MEELARASAYANAVGAAAAMPMLCGMLARRGLLASFEIEALRQAALQGYDRAREQPDFPEKLAQPLEEIRKIADGMWHRAAQAAERPG